MSVPTPSTSPLLGKDGKGATVPSGDAGGKTDLPRTFGRYVLFDLIGKGGMAEIYLAKARTTEAGGSRLVVVKQILAELSSNVRFAEAFVQEAKLAARLSHANVVQVLDLGRAPFVLGKDPRDDVGSARLFIAMEYVEGLDLNELLRRCARAKVPLPIEFALLIVMETLRGLDYAHRRTDDAGKPLGIVHRDVSPSNVLVSVEGEIKLCDFGIARAMMSDGAPRAGGEDTAMPADAIQGKAGYMSPEHARGEQLDARADVFAAGVILWELLAGRRLYRVKNAVTERAEQKPETLLMVARRAEIPKVPGRGLPYEEELHAIVDRALAVQRDARFDSAAQMLAALQAFVSKARLVASPIRLGEWLTQHFGGELVETRRARERAVKALELGPAATVTPAAPPAVAAATPRMLTPALARIATDERRLTDEPTAAPTPKPQNKLIWVVLFLFVIAVAVAGYLLTRG